MMMLIMKNVEEDDDKQTIFTILTALGKNKVHNKLSLP